MSDLTMRDSDGAAVRDGDLIHFSYGIPPVGVEARVLERNGKLFAIIPPPHQPSESTLANLRRHVGAFWKSKPPRKRGAGEIEANIFAKRDSNA